MNPQISKARAHLAAYYARRPATIRTVVVGPLSDRDLTLLMIEHCRKTARPVEVILCPAQIEADAALAFELALARATATGVALSRFMTRIGVEPIAA